MASLRSRLTIAYGFALVGNVIIFSAVLALVHNSRELQMAQLNRSMEPGVDTVFLMTDIEHGYISSTMVREIASLGGDVSSMVPSAVLRRLRRD